MGWHMPALQTCAAVQVVPHAPQFFGSLATVTHALPHFVVPGELHWHMPFMQLLPAPQTLPQLPQLLGSNWVTTQVLLQLV